MIASRMNRLFRRLAIALGSVALLMVVGCGNKVTFEVGQTLEPVKLSASVEMADGEMKPLFEGDLTLNAGDAESFTIDGDADPGTRWVRWQAIGTDTGDVVSKGRRALDSGEDVKVAIGAMD